LEGITPVTPAVFFDRDGVLIEDSHYVAGVHEVRLIPGVAEAVRRVQAAGFATVVVTNQSGVARGMFAEDVVHQVHKHIEAETGLRFDRWEHCPHHTDGTVPQFTFACDCRKPKPGMLRRAAAALGLDLSASWLIGDRESDLQAALAAGCRSILVKTGYGPNVPVHEPNPERKLVAVVPSVVEAVETILTQVTGG
jgi:D-glycero-D-manno-heptose 1,7-bisphosphate phosphatase